MLIRDASQDESASLAVLADAATRRLLSWLWDQAADAGQSSFEVGRETVRADEASTSHHSQWRVADSDGQIAGGLNSYLLEPQPPATYALHVAEVLKPLNELKSIAQGTWYVSVASVFPEYRGQGVGQLLLGEADRLAEQGGATRVSLLVASFNPDAHRLYERLGFFDWERRPFVPFYGSDPDGEWILMAKDLHL